jgi:hypothetical protein
MIPMRISLLVSPTSVPGAAGPAAAALPELAGPAELEVPALEPAGDELTDDELPDEQAASSATTASPPAAMARSRPRRRPASLFHFTMLRPHN